MILVKGGTPPYKLSLPPNDSHFAGPERGILQGNTFSVQYPGTHHVLITDSVGTVFDLKIEVSLRPTKCVVVKDKIWNTNTGLAWENQKGDVMTLNDCLDWCQNFGQAGHCNYYGSSHVCAFTKVLRGGLIDYLPSAMAYGGTWGLGFRPVIPPSIPANPALAASHLSPCTGW